LASLPNDIKSACGVSKLFDLPKALAE
jgi:hypothetical protein